jgi:hypothetical protein
VSHLSETFFGPNYAVFMQVTEICNGFLIFGTLFLHRLQEAAFALEVLILAHTYSSHVHHYGTSNLEVKPIFVEMKRLKKLPGLEVRFLDSGDLRLSRHRANQREVTLACTAPARLRFRVRDRSCDLLRRVRSGSCASWLFVI